MTQPFTFLALYGSYQTLELALYQNNQCIDTYTETKQRASSALIPLIDELLSKNNLSLKMLNYIALDAGPGAFTSLRVLLSTINGISMATNIPLVAIDGLHALADTTKKALSEKQYAGSSYTLSCLLNAYNNEVYHALFSLDNEKKCLTLLEEASYNKIDIFLENLLKKQYPHPIIFTGNGSTLHQQKIEKYYSAQQYEILQIPHASTKSIALLSIEKYQDKESCLEIQPLYLKKETFAVKS